VRSLSSLPIVAIVAIMAIAATAAAQAPAAGTRLVVTPAVRSVVAGDSLQLRGQLLDGAGQPVPGARVMFVGAGGRFEGNVDSTGLVRAGAVGTIPVTAVGLVSGAKPVVERFEVAMVPGVATRVEVTPRPARLLVGQRVSLGAEVFSAAGDHRADPVRWASSAPAVVRVAGDGSLMAESPGRATLSATVGGATTRWPVEVIGAAGVRVDVTPAATSARTGDVVHFRAAVRDAAGREITGLAPAWLFTPGKGMVDPDGAFVAYEPGTYQVTASVGGRSGDASVTVADRDVRRPTRVVGKVLRSAFATSEVWLHPNGKVAYLGTIMGGDRVYAIDISNPDNPVIADSIVVNARSINDMMTSADGNTMVITREGAADRRNGIVIADTHDPLHPKAIAEFTDGVTSGVHSAFIHTQPKYGTYVYLTNDGTGALHVIDINDPAHPKQVATWKTPRADAGRMLHDIDVQNGLLYGSWWNDGVVILDVGNGIKGGTPSSPKFVSQYKYDLDKLYRDVEAVTGPGYTRGTHTAWRYKNYVFIADEVYRNGPVAGAKDASASRMYGTLQVIDVSDILHPKAVASYTPEYGGVHNVWVAGDTLYLGAYDGGFHVFDVSGELRGDLRAQGREIGQLNTADMQGNTKNAAFTWGVVVNPKDGLAYVNDFNNGLWIVKVEPKPAPVP
jgi:hypothetical protein